MCGGGVLEDMTCVLMDTTKDNSGDKGSLENQLPCRGMKGKGSQNCFLLSMTFKDGPKKHDNLLDIPFISVFSPKSTFFIDLILPVFQNVSLTMYMLCFPNQQKT